MNIKGEKDIESKNSIVRVLGMHLLDFEHF